MVTFFRQKRSLLARIKGIQEKIHKLQNSPLISLEKALQNELNIILNRERQFWATKSRITWLNHGDANTSFFHTSTIKRRRRNSISSLRDKAGNWITDMSLLTQHIYNHFQSCYTTDSIGNNIFPTFQIIILQLPVLIIIIFFNPYQKPKLSLRLNHLGGTKHLVMMAFICFSFKNS